MKVITFGRNDNNDVVINDCYVGRNHCQIIENEGKFFVVDLNSTNGTYVNGTRITGQQAVSLSDEIRIGQTTLNWQTHFTSAPVPQLPTEVPANEGKSTSKAIIIACIALLIAIGGIVAYFALQPYTKHASALPRNMVALMSVNMRTLQKQTEINKNDVSDILTKIEAEVFDNRVNLAHSGIKFSAPIYTFIEELDGNGNGSYGLVLSLSDSQQFGDFLLNLINDRDVILNKYNNLQYASLDHIFVGFDKNKCLCYVSTYMDEYQREDRGLELLKQNVTDSGKKSKLFSLLDKSPISSIFSGDECERLLNQDKDIRNLLRNSGIELANSYFSVRMLAQNNGLEIKAKSIDSKKTSQNIFDGIKGTKLSEFSTEDMAFAATNVNGANLLREILASLTPDTRNEINQFFDEFSRQSVDLESFIKAINGDTYLSIPYWPSNNTSYRNRQPELVFMAEMPSSRELNNSMHSIQNLIAYDDDFKSIFESVEKDNNFLCIKSDYSYKPRPHTSQQQYVKEIKNNILYVSVNVGPLLKEFREDRDVNELMPYIKYCKRVSTSASATDLAFKIELTNTWQYVLKNF